MFAEIALYTCLVIVLLAAIGAFIEPEQKPKGDEPQESTAATRRTNTTPGPHLIPTALTNKMPPPSSTPQASYSLTTTTPTTSTRPTIIISPPASPTPSPEEKVVGEKAKLSPKQRRNVPKPKPKKPRRDSPDDVYVPSDDEDDSDEYSKPAARGREKGRGRKGRGNKRNSI